jgi:hypothetical protein
MLKPKRFKTDLGCLGTDLAARHGELLGGGG